ncbi:hypothetical protein GCM10010404_85580 [Nonomuraea africana]|uniref:Uncharacterized protein n=1 Tax=Nonomuraea africana TaxID=46171 RepID=A0ABR9K914_9ACTN|nr:hypothetical protein [Nonomuraea africana]MBE1558253.1 hypothetical protein [Nonomuraea africana]
MTSARPRQALQRSIQVHIEGRIITVLEGELVAYFAASYKPDSEYPIHVHITTDKEEAWDRLRTSLELEPGTYGHVLAYNLLKEKPTLIKCLGRIDSPEQEPVVP